jgi:HAD superfamily hydrolase (TIGR01509 family)
MPPVDSDVPERSVFVLDLDGTLVDSVYQHVMAWQRALEEVGVPLAIWRIHRRIGMSGGLLVQAVLREAHRALPEDVINQAKSLHGKYYADSLPSIRPLPGAIELLEALDEMKIRWALATSGQPGEARAMLKLLQRDVNDVVLIDGGQVRYAKPDPDLLIAATEKLAVDPHHALVVGDSIWDMLAARRAGALGVGVLSGGFSRAELEAAQAFRVYNDPQDLLDHIDELGVRTVAQG